MIARAGDVEYLKNKIEYLARERIVREMMRLAARKKVVKKYTWENIGEQLEKTLKNIIFFIRSSRYIRQ